MKDRAAMQRTLARAYSEHPDVTKQDIGAALRRYDSLETRAQKRAMRDVWAAAGADGVAATGAIDPATLERLLVTGDRTDSVTASDVGAAAKTYSKLDSSAQTTYENLLDRKPAGATTLAADADSDSLSTLLAAGCSGTTASVSTTAVGGATVLAGGTDRAYAIETDPQTLAVGGSGVDCEFLNSVAEGVTSDSVDAGTFAERYNNLDQKDTFKTVLTDLDEESSEELIQILTNTDSKHTDEIGRGLKRLDSLKDHDVSEFFAFETGDATAARATVLRAVGDDDFEAVTADRAAQFSTDVQELSSNSDVEGVDK